MVRMNVAIYQEKKENEKTGKGRKELADFREAACCTSVVLQRAARQKMVCIRGVPGVTNLPGKPTTTSSQPKWGRGFYHHTEVAVDWCSFRYFH